MKAIIYHGPHDFRVDDVPDPKIQAPTDAVVRIERTAICGSDLHMYHGEPMPVTGFAMGHEFLGTIEDVGADVRRFQPGQRVLVACTIGCGICSFCQDHLWSACSEATPFGPLTNIFGSPLKHHSGLRKSAAGRGAGRAGRRLAAVPARGGESIMNGYKAYYEWL